MSIQHYQRVISLLPNATMIVSSSGKLLATNHAANTMLNSIESKNGSIFDALDPNTQSDALAYLRQCASSSQPVVGSIHLNAALQNQIHTTYGAVLEPRSGDEEAVILLRLQPRKESNVRFLILQQQIEDLNQEVARRLDAELKLRNQTKQLEVTLTSIGDAVIITDEQTRVTFLNPVAEALTGWRLEHASGKAVEDIFVVVNEHTGLTIENPAKNAILKQTVISIDIESLLIPKHGKRLSINTTAAPIKLNSQIEGVIIVFHDVSEKRKLERQLLERANRLELMNQRKTQFLTMLAHELRSPLTPISSAAQLMKLQANAPSVFDEPRRVIDRQVSHLKRLIDDMLDVSRINSGKMKIVKTNIDLVSLIDSVCCDFSPQFVDLNINRVTELPTTPIWINADSDRITQVVHNLLNNALKFTPNGGTVTVSLTANDSSINLQVRDTGKGFEETAIHDLFEPFTQAEQTLERSAGGLGLGLSLVKGIVDLHNGNVSASSDGIDRGANICISLPLTNIHEHPTVESVSKKCGKSHRILLIEDDHDAADMMKQVLELLGHEVCWSETGPDGVKKATTMIPTVILCDIGLPGLDGFSVAKLLRSSIITSSIPLVALTGYGETEFVKRAKDAGFDLHITKPASLADIQAALAVTR